MAQQLIDQHPEPLIGLHHVREYLQQDSPSFWCSLCEVTCGSDARDVINHVTGRKHRMNYISIHHLSYLEVIISNPMSERDVLLLEYSRIIETAEGRSKIEMKAKARSSGSNDPHGNKPQGDIENARLHSELQPERCSFQDSSIGCVLHNIALRAGAKNPAELLQRMPTGLITNEDEVAKALEIANVLTRSLLEHRLASSSPK